MPRVSRPSFSIPCLLLVASLSAQESKAVLHAPLLVLPADSAPFQRLADFDGDGDLDAIGTRVHSNGVNVQVVIWLNTGGRFDFAYAIGPSIAGMTPGVETLLNVATADFNSDGKADFVIARGNTARKYVSTGLPGVWTPAFTDTSSTTIGLTITGLAIGDFDADGALDYAVAGRTASPGVSVHAELASGNHAQWSLPATGTDFRLAAAELDGVPGAELMVFNRGGSSAYVLGMSGSNLQLGTTLASSIPATNPNTWKWIAGDIDNDLDTDVIVFRHSDGFTAATYQVFRRTGSATLDGETPKPGGPSEYLADVDGDGDLDGVCCGGGGGGGGIGAYPQLNFASWFQVAENRGGGDFAPSWSFPACGSVSLAGAADVDGDGDVDLVAGRCVFYGRGAWTEHPMPLAAGPNATVSMRSRDVQDVDRDGDPDLTTLRNRGDGVMAAFDDSVAPPPGKTFTTSIAIDVDGDGAPDRIHRQYAGALFEYMVLLRNNGGGHYHYAGACAPPGVMFGQPADATADNWLAADCDGDGDQDLIANSNPAATSQWTSQIFWNDNGAFSAGPAFGPFGGGRIDAVADFDGDGHPDLATTAFTNAYVMRGTGNPSSPFTAPSMLWPIAPFEPAAVTIADLDDDGRLDIARAYDGNRLLLSMNTTTPGGPPTFTEHLLLGAAVTISPTFGTSTPRGTLTAADFDGDGRTDLALGRIPGEPNVGTILRRIGWSNPPTIADYQIVQHTFIDGFAADADGDGDVDLVGERTVRNPRFHGAAAGRRMQDLPGVAGEDGAVPLLGISGPFRGGEHTVLRLTGVPGPTLSLLCVSLGTATIPDQPLPGLTCYIDPAAGFGASWDVTTDGQGRAAASTTMPIDLPFGLEGLTFHFQAFVLDLSAPTIGTQTNLLSMRIGS